MCGYTVEVKVLGIGMRGVIIGLPCGGYIAGRNAVERLVWFFVGNVMEDVLMFLQV